MDARKNPLRIALDGEPCDTIPLGKRPVIFNVQGDYQMVGLAKVNDEWDEFG